MNDIGPCGDESASIIVNLNHKSNIVVFYNKLQANKNNFNFQFLILNYKS